MITLIFSFLANLFLSFNETSLGNKNNECSLFETYISKFQSTTLPFKLDRKGVFDLSAAVFDSLKMTYKKSPYPLIESKFNCFIPEELNTKKSNAVWRSLFLLPKIDSITPVIVASDYFEDEEQNSLSLFLITYKDKKCLSYLKIAEYTLYVSEKFVEIANNYGLITKSYIFKFPPTNDHPNLDYLDEIENNYFIGRDGIIIEKQQINRTGYFKSDWSGYTFIGSK
jgi:hypothetical protein